jgi:hypothetical protein
MKKILLVLMMCTFGAHAAVVVTHAYGYGVHPVVIAPRPVVVVPRPVVVAPAPVVVTAAPVVTSAPVAHPVAAAVRWGWVFTAIMNARMPTMKSTICRTKELMLIINITINSLVRN